MRLPEKYRRHEKGVQPVDSPLPCPCRPVTPLLEPPRVHGVAAGGRAARFAAGNHPHRFFDAPGRHGVLLDAQDDRALAFNSAQVRCLVDARYR